MGERVFLGVDLGGTNTKFALVREGGEVLESNAIPTKAMRKPEEVAHDIAQEVERLLQIAREQERDIPALGIGIPGRIDWEEGICYLLPNFPNKWHQVPIRRWLEEETGLPVGVINDVRAITLAEKRFGAGRDVESMAMVAIGTGVGGGIVLNGELVIGQHGSAGELGHITVEAGGTECGCGNRGCLEAYATGPAMVAAAIRAVVQQNDTVIRDIVEGDLNRVTTKVVSQAVEAGDRVAIEIMQRIGEYIGQAVANVYVTIDPELIVIGGGVSRAGEPLLESIRKGIKKRLYMVPWENVRLVRAELDMDAGTIGTATWAKERFDKGLIG